MQIAERRHRPSYFPLKNSERNSLRHNAFGRRGVVFDAPNDEIMDPAGWSR
jgi:hypothetical protein